FETSSGYELLTSTWALVGDFDIEWDFDLTTYPNTTAWALGLRAHADGDNYFHTRIEYDSTRRYKKFANDGGIIEGATEVNTSDTSGKMRITRTGDVFRAYRDSAGWVQIGSDSDIAGASGKVMYVLVFAETWIGSPTMEGTIDNFTVNSGSWSVGIQNTDSADNWVPYVAIPDIQDNKLRCDVDSGNTTEGVESNFTITGNTDIRTDWDIVLGPDANNWYGGLRVEVGSKWFYIVRTYRAGTSQKIEVRDSTFGWGTTFTTTATTGKFRIVRTSYTVL
ncbi:unnamed protein product, partial [marine sediment metagenome]